MTTYTLIWTNDNSENAQEFENDAAAWEAADALMERRDNELTNAYEAAKENGNDRDIQNAWSDYENAPTIETIEKETEDGEIEALTR